MMPAPVLSAETRAAPVSPGLLPDALIEPVLHTMQTHFDQPLPLETLAEVAGLSAFHFHRRFRAVVGIPPNEFLTVLRLQEAKRLLLTTSLSVTDICFEVGYASLGTFTARFTHLVGISPGRLRQFADTAALPSLDHLRGLPCVARSSAVPTEGVAEGVAGEVRSSVDVPGPIFIGLFPKPIPQARPVASAVLAAPGRYHLATPPDGRYYLLAAALPWAEDPHIPALPGTKLLVGSGAEPVLVRQGRSVIDRGIMLRAPLPTDPPVLLCLPFLFSRRQAGPALSA